MSQLDNLIGKKFNNWTVIEELLGGKVRCECSCEAHTIKVLDKYSVKSGKSKSCGCLRREQNNLKGQKFNHWTVIEDIDNEYALCQCDCENKTVRKVQKLHLKNNTSQSCGCIKKMRGVKENLVGQTFNYLTIIEELGGGKVKVRCSCPNQTIKTMNKDQVKRGLIKSCGCKTAELKSQAFRTNLVGQTFNDWTIIEELGNGRVKARCSCNNIYEVPKATILNGTSKSCGHNTTAFKDLTGQQFGNWLVIEELGYGKVKVRCQCEKHTEQIIQKPSLLNGASKSCGCLKTELMQSTLLEKYGEITANKVSNPREPWQIQAVSNKKSFEDYLKGWVTTSKKPTIQQLVQALGIQEAQLGRKIHEYSLENYIEYIHERSQYEDEILNFLKTIYTGEIICNSRNIIPPKELDIYIPEYKLAIEFNGTYWHSALCVENDFHQQKTIACAKQKIHLIHIFEYEWANSETQEKLKHYIKLLLLPANNKTIYGRKTEVREISNSESIQFCNKYHLQGSVNSKINLGIFSENDELLGVMTFGSPRFNNKFEFEMHRMCFKDNLTVIGGAQKMFSYFITNYNPESIITYVDISKFTGNIYTKLGFTPISSQSVTEPNYKWISLDRNQFILSRYQTQKHLLLEQGLGTPDQTEIQIMESLNFTQVFDSGNLRLEWNKT